MIEKKAQQETFLSRENGLVSKLVCFIVGIVQKVEKIPGKYLEIAACVIYAIAHLLMAIVHEPWYDEAVAWNIARTASLQDILFNIPHYEGHPPLWHLVLLPFAKLGAPYELSLSIISLIFAGLACSLIIWKAPFPRIIRLLLPFTYFFFYQYGVISRPYCMMMLAFVLLAMTYTARNEHPVKYTASLAFLCLTSAYGIVIAGGLAIVWVFEIWNLQKIIPFIKTLPKDKRFWNLLSLLILALLLIVEILPRDDTFATTFTDDAETNSLLFCFSYMLFALPMEVSLSSIYMTVDVLKMVQINMLLMLTTCALGFLFWIIVVMWGKSKNTLLTLIVPYVMFAAFASLVYVNRHHIGVGLFVFMFWFWITCKTETENKFMTNWSTVNKTTTKNIVVITGTLAMIVSLYWNMSSCIQDINWDYAAGRYEAQFIKDHHLDEYKIMVAWDIKLDDADEIEEMDINHCIYADNVLPYFDHNIFFNFNDGRDDIMYSTHKVPSEEYTQSHLEEWSKELPDVCLTYVPLGVYDDVDVKKIYSVVSNDRKNAVWKGTPIYSRTRIYVRNDLLETVGLESIEPVL